MSRGVTQQTGTYGSRPDKGEESTYQPLVLLEEGQYQVTPFRSGQHWYMGKRADLRVEFALVSGDHQGELITGYWQVKWLNSNRFSAGPKSNFFRMYQACFGRQDNNEFDLGCLRNHIYLAEIENVVHDSKGRVLAEVNQYSRVTRLLEVVEEREDDLPF